MTKAKKNQKLPFVRKLLFGVGDSTNSLFFTVIMLYYLFFLTDVVGLTPVLAGAVIFIGKAWDAITDPAIGYFSDKTKSRWGRRRPYLLFGIVPACLSFILIWQKFPIENQTLLFLTYVGLNLVFWLFFTIVAIPYAALMPELSLDYDDRTSLISARMSFSIVFGLVAAAVPMSIVGAYTNKSAGYAVMATILGLFGIVPILITFFGTRERKEFQEKASLSIVSAFRETMRNKAFMIAMLIFLLSWVCVDIVGAVFIYFITYWICLPDGYMSLFLGVLFVTAVLFLPFWVFVSSKIGKKKTYIIGMSFWAVVMTFSFLLRPGIPITVLVFFSFLAGIGVSTAHLIPWAMIIDCVDLDELKTKARREGMYTGFTLFLQKFASAFAIFITGLFLEFSGYVENMAQNEDALFAIRFVFGSIPALLLILSIIVAAKYPITKEKYEEIRAKLDKRR